ncbi:MAG: hypothetical protein ACLQU5_32820 [Isosphaeraceae bacterium]
MNQDVSHDSTQAAEQSPYLPSGWYWSTVGELAADTLIGLDRGRQHQSSTPPGFAYVKMNNVTTDGRVTLEDIVYVTATEAEAKRYSLRTGDVLFNTRNSIELVGKVGLVQSPPPNTVFNNNLMRIRFRDGIHGKFVCYQMCSPDFRDRMAYAKRATTNVAAVYAKNLFPLPVAVAPHPEQGRIVAKIEELFSDLDAGIVALERVRANLKRYRAAVLKAAVEGKLTEDWRAQHPDTEPASVLLEGILTERRRQWEQAELAKFAKTGKQPPKGWKEKYKQPAHHELTDLPELPSSWTWISLGMLAWSVKDGPHYTPKYSTTGIPFISGGNIRPEGIDFSSAKHISSELHDELSLRCKPEYGDLLYTKGGTTGIARINWEQFEFNVWVHVAVLKLVEDIDK